MLQYMNVIQVYAVQYKQSTICLHSSKGLNTKQDQRGDGAPLSPGFIMADVEDANGSEILQ